MYRVSLLFFFFCGSGNSFIELMEKKYGKVKVKGVLASLVSLKDIDYNVMSQNFDDHVMSSWQG